MRLEGLIGRKPYDAGGRLTPPSVPAGRAFRRRRRAPAGRGCGRRARLAGAAPSRRGAAPLTHTGSARMALIGEFGPSSWAVRRTISAATSMIRSRSSSFSVYSAVSEPSAPRRAWAWSRCSLARSSRASDSAFSRAVFSACSFSTMPRRGSVVRLGRRLEPLGLQLGALLGRPRLGHLAAGGGDRLVRARRRASRLCNSPSSVEMRFTSPSLSRDWAASRTSSSARRVLACSAWVRCSARVRLSASALSRSRWTRAAVAATRPLEIGDPGPQRGHLGGQRGDLGLAAVRQGGGLLEAAGEAGQRLVLVLDAAFGAP